MIAYLTAIATLVGVRALLTLGLNVQWGLTGLVNLGAVAFFAVLVQKSPHCFGLALGAPVEPEV